ncbi:uncharacterized protein [Arachis hypogaea]|uniref:uncharacterized protein n=1 Tax=Arachis hypogaea TaxID=3818 RepID=UPI003B2233D6
MKIFQGKVSNLPAIRIHRGFLLHLPISQSSSRALTVAAPNCRKPPWLIIVAHIVVSSLTIVHSLDNHSLIHSLSSLSCSLTHFFSRFSVEEGACGFDDDDDEQQWPNETEMVLIVREGMFLIVREGS